MDTTTKSVLSEQACDGSERATALTIAKPKVATTRNWSKAWNAVENA